MLCGRRSADLHSAGAYTYGGMHRDRYGKQWAAGGGDHDPTEDPTEPATEPERETVQLPNYLADASASYEKNVIYVKTALGERSKDAVHEYLADLGLPGTNDGKYILNSAESPYILQVGDTVELCYYTDDSNLSRWSKSDPKEAVFSTPTQTGTKLSDGTYKFEITYHAKGAGTGEIHLGSQTFYVSVPDPDQELKDFHYDHADIEITDGGFTRSSVP